eukprot:3221768-Rhodomonas_salina.4
MSTPPIFRATCKLTPATGGDPVAVEAYFADFCPREYEPGQVYCCAGEPVWADVSSIPFPARAFRSCSFSLVHALSVHSCSCAAAACRWPDQEQRAGKGCNYRARRGGLPHQGKVCCRGWCRRRDLRER